MITSSIWGVIALSIGGVIAALIGEVKESKREHSIHSSICKWGKRNVATIIRGVVASLFAGAGVIASLIGGGAKSESKSGHQIGSSINKSERKEWCNHKGSDSIKLLGE